MNAVLLPPATMLTARSARRSPQADESLPSWPLDAPGMPMPGPDFLAAARAAGDDVSQVIQGKGKKSSRLILGTALQRLYDRALRLAGFELLVKVKSGAETVRFVPGHVWAQHREAYAQALGDLRLRAPSVDGPRPCRVMVIGKMPWVEEAQAERNFVGPTGEEMVRAIERAKIHGAGDWYVTNVLKFMPPHGNRDVAATWLADCLPLLHMELRLVRPDFILCMGTDAVKALLGHATALKSVEGRVLDYSIPIGREFGDPETHKCLLTAVLHPVNALKSEDQRRMFDRGLSRFKLLTEGVRFDLAEPEVDHRVIDTYEDAVRWANAAQKELLTLPVRRRLVAWDAEWHGKSPHNRGAYLRTVQVSWKDRAAVVFRLRRQGGRATFVDRNGRSAERRLFKLLREFCRKTRCRSVGHFLVADLEWLQAKGGFDPTEFCRVPLHDADGVPAWKLLRNGNGWLDTGLMAHAVEETAFLGLEVLLGRYTPIPRYELRLDEWKSTYCTKTGIKVGNLEGYGECPEEVLIGIEEGPAEGYGTRLSTAADQQSYAAYDADGTRRLTRALLPLLDRDYQGNNCWEPCWESMITQPVILEMKRVGVLINRPRMADLTMTFLAAANNQVQKIRDWADWPTFNPRSLYHVREYLFGEALNGKPYVAGQPVRVRPEGAKSVGAMPLFDTSKPPRLWEEIVASGLQLQVNATTAKSTLAILAAEFPEWAEPVGLLRDHRFLDQVVKGLLRPPLAVQDDTPEEFLLDEDGELVYDGGLAGAIDGDGRVRTSLRPTAETGRWKSRNPNMQNLSKSRDKDYERMLGQAYIHKIRSCIIASPGCALVEFDYTGAELAVTAFMSGDRAMIDHVRRMALPESHPDHWDMHARVALPVFGLDVAPTKSAMKKAGLEHFRTLAKNVFFGLLYGRGAKAIAVQARETRKAGEPPFTVEQAQAVIDTILATYPGVVQFFRSACDRVADPRWGRNAMGRYRRLPPARDRGALGEFERQMKNFYIQGGVAGMVNRGLANLQYLRDEALQAPELFRMLLQIHDAGLIEVPYEHVDYVAGQLVPRAMIDAVPFWPTDAAGVLLGTGPYHLGLETSVMPAWGEYYTAAECRQHGFSEHYAAA